MQLAIMKLILSVCLWYEAEFSHLKMAIWTITNVSDLTKTTPEQTLVWLKFAILFFLAKEVMFHAKYLNPSTPPTSPHLLLYQNFTSSFFCLGEIPLFTFHGAPTPSYENTIVNRTSQLGAKDYLGVGHTSTTRLGGMEIFLVEVFQFWILTKMSKHSVKEERGLFTNNCI